MLFKKKERLSELEEQHLTKIILFYDRYKDLIIEYSDNAGKRNIIKKIYDALGYNDLPKLYSDNASNNENGIPIYRGISANSVDELKQYTYEYINGEVFYGGRASIYGTGIYTVTGDNANVASDYASDGRTNNIGLVIESKMESDSNIINNKEISGIRDFINRKLDKKKMETYLNLLEDDGVLSAILGYDAIYVEDKNYVVVLNRSKMIINEIDAYNKLANLSNHLKI